MRYAAKLRSSKQAIHGNLIRLECNLSVWRAFLAEHTEGGSWREGSSGYLLLL